MSAPDRFGPPESEEERAQEFAVLLNASPDLVPELVRVLTRFFADAMQTIPEDIDQQKMEEDVRAAVEEFYETTGRLPLVNNKLDLTHLVSYLDEIAKEKVAAALLQAFFASVKEDPPQA